MTKVKICGITTKREIEYINEYKPDFAGFVMFFPKSKRNINPSTAKELLNALITSVKSVAVMVNPSMEQINIAKECGFDYVQIHGNTESSLLCNSPLPIIRAFNVSDIDRFDEYSKIDNIVGYLFDSAVPGSGKTFDWILLDKLPRDNKKIFILAGGLDADNVADAIKRVTPDGVDVSSGVENDNGNGKSKEKIKTFISNARLV
ncbi:MAG: phosphoribosylanthranilate isomerase [Ruminococcus sp.]|nr:phosphoribosylanthranilate isomerase [Ruminococcus sp.]